LVHANDPVNSSEQHELPVGEVLSDFSRASYGKQFSDHPDADGFTTLSAGVFWWLINIRSGYLIFRQGNVFTIEPYLPSRFARQFGYDQLYVGNPNLGFHFSGNLYEGARAQCG